MGRLDETIKRWGHQPWFAAVGRRVAPRIDRFLLKVTGGRGVTIGRKALPTLFLTTIGRKSGKERITPLLFVRDGERIIVAGSNWGQTHHPAWALNLRDRPEATVQVGRDRFPVTARIAEGEERATLWSILERKWPAYDTYKDRSGRDIMIFVLERAG
ncbi:MAG TPA: nitroreductase/quinone reductase family protein [Actinomycetota bacterium]|nr:nitroreductase/quinone reductase family protein [Actinomycetota bacterium]